MMTPMHGAGRSPVQFSLRFLFLLATAAAAVSAALAAALYSPSLLFLLGLGAVVGGLVAIGRYILGPLDRAARHRMRPTQFTMVDFLSLMFLFQLPMAALHAFFDVRDDPQVWVFDVFGWVACSLMWGLSVSTLSRAGIEKTWQRGVFLAFILPVAYFGSIVFVVVIFGSGIWLYHERSISSAPWPIVVAIVGGLAIAFHLSALFVRKMAAESEAADRAEVNARETDRTDLT
jgi:hypothetical protein